MSYKKKRRGRYRTDGQPANLKFKGGMKDAFNILTKAMDEKGSATLLEYGKHKETYRSGADELRRATDFTATEFDMNLAKGVKDKLKSITDAKTPDNIKPDMKAIIDICGNYLAQHAEYNKDKGPAFKLLVQKMKEKGNTPLYTRNSQVKPYNNAARDLEKSKGLDVDYHDPDLTKIIKPELENTVKQHTPANMKDEMQDTTDKSAKYLSHKAIHDEERGEAFKLLIKELEKTGGKPFTPKYKGLETNHLAAHALKNAPRLNVPNPDPASAPVFKTALENVVLKETPPDMMEEMREVIRMSSNYLSAYNRDRSRAMQSLLKFLKEKGNEELVRRASYGMTYANGAQEIEEAPCIVPFLPVKDIADEVRGKLTEGMKGRTPPELEQATKVLIKDVSGHLSQPVALRRVKVNDLIGGVAGELYPVHYLANVMESMGDKKLYEYKDYSQTYAGAASELKAAGHLQTSQHLELANTINEEMKTGVATKVGPAIHADLRETMTAASQHLAKIGGIRGEALKHLVKEMHDKGDEKLARLQGYDHSYKEAAGRVQAAKSLETDRVDPAAYKEVGSKLNKLMQEKPPPREHAAIIQDVVDETSKFLAAPMPDTKGEKRKVLAELMGRKKDDVLGADGHYKMTYAEGGDKFVDAPFEISPVSMDPVKQREITRDVKSVVPKDNIPLQKALEETTKEAGSHLTDVLKGRKEAMDVIHAGLKEGADKDLIKSGKIQATYAEGAKMVEDAPHFKKKGSDPKFIDEVEKKIESLPKSKATPLAEKHLKSTTEIASKYIAAEAKEKGDKMAGRSGSPTTGGPITMEAGGPGSPTTALSGRAGSTTPGGPGSPTLGGPGSPTSGGPGSGVAGRPGSPTPGGPGSPTPRGPGSPTPGGPGSPTLGRPGSGVAGRLGSPTSGGPGSPTPGTPTSPTSGGPGSGAAGRPGSPTPGGPGSPTPGGPVSPTSGGPGSGVAGRPGSPTTGIPGSPTPAGPGSDVAGRPGSPSTGDSGIAGRLGSPSTVGSGVAGGPGSARGPESGAGGLRGTGRDAGGPAGTDERGRGRVGDSDVDDDGGRSGGRKKGGGGGRGRSGGTSDDDGPGGRGGRGGTSASRDRQGRDVGRGRDDIRGKAPGKGGQDLGSGRDVGGVRELGGARRDQSSHSSEEEPVDPNACPCVLAAARVKRRHLRRQQRRETLRQNKAHALDLLRKELAAKGETPFYVAGNPFTLTHKQASDWLGQSMRVEPSVKTSSDVTRLQAKFELKLFELMERKYPSEMQDAMQDVIIESARKLAENYISKHYQKAAKNSFITEMQKKGNTLLTEDGETYFYAAQRLKRSDDLYEPSPCEQTSPYLQQELDNTIRGHSIPRKMVGTMKGYSKTIADYLSTRVGQPDKEITAYCTLLDEMEAQDDKVLVDKNMKVSYREATDYLRQLVSNEDKIKKPDRMVSDEIDRNLTQLVNSSDAMKECDQGEVGKVKTRCTNLLTSYVSSQVGKTEVLKSIIEAMENQGDAVLLRHGPVVRTFEDGADRLRNKNSGQIQSYISKSGPPDPVVVRKINIRMGNVANETLTKMPDLTKDVTTYLAKTFTEPTVSRVCQCRKSVPVQCELWCDQILRRVTRECCPCPRCSSQPARTNEQCPTYALHTIHYDHSPNDRISRALLQPPTRDETNPSTDTTSYYATVSSTSNHNSDKTYSLSNRLEAERGQETQPTFSSACSPQSSGLEQVVSTTEMCDWNAMLVSLMWNMQAWRHWIHEQMNRAQTHNHQDSDELPSWASYEKRVSIETLQWRQYNIFSKQLATKLSCRYKNKRIVSPTRDTNKTKEYLACQSEMIDMIGMFKKWTHWLSLVVNETRDMEVPATTAKNTLNKLRWNYFFYKLQERAEDWRKYDMYFEECWKENTLKKIPGWVPGWSERAVWVVSACGAVPSGAVPCGAGACSAGPCRRPAWLARTTHRSQVLPAALLPSKHCCIVYADEKVFQYSKYQVLCNADVEWIPWHSGSVSSSAVPIGNKSYAGRVVYKGSHLIGPVLPPHYRCHVVLMERPFAFNSYQLLVFTNTDDWTWTKPTCNDG